MTKKYFESHTSGNGQCWFCDSPTDFIYDNGKDEFFACLGCFKYKTPHFKKKSKIIKKFLIKIKKNAQGEGGSDD